MINLIIVEPKAHQPGHYTDELFQYCSHIIHFVDSVIVLTPFGFRENWKPIDKCEVQKLLERTEDHIFDPLIILQKKIYNYQWEFYKEAKRFIDNTNKENTIIHFWDIISILPLWYFFHKENHKRVLNLKSVYKEQIPFFGSKKLGELQGILSKKLVKTAADKFIVHTDEIFNDAKFIGISEKKISKIGIGIDTNMFGYIKNEIRKELNLPLDEFLLLFFGVIRKEKGIFELIDHVKSSRLDAKIFIVGENHLSTPLEKLINDKGIEDKFILCNKYIIEKDIEKYFRASDAVLICHRKGFKGESGVMLKSIQFEVPVITTSDLSTAKIVKENYIGELFSFQNNEDLNIAIKKIKKEENLIIENLKKIKNKLSWRKRISEFYNLYTELI